MFPWVGCKLTAMILSLTQISLAWWGQKGDQPDHQQFPG